MVFNNLNNFKTLAQIIPDNTLGTESSVVIDTEINSQPIELITKGAKRGANLFHSFEIFNIREGNKVYFNNPAEINRIFGRVTRKHSSVILGTLGVLGNGNADLFLINPQGIIFGSGASLDLQGSFIASSADSIVFQNNFLFSATNPTNVPLLMVSVPIGLQFGVVPKDIVIDPLSSQDLVTLQVGLEKTLVLIGGNLIIQKAQLVATGGRVELGSIGQAGEVNLSSIEKGWSYSLDITQAPGGTIVINASESVEVIANAFEGRGGNIDLITEGLFGITPRDSTTDLSDITASSDLGIRGNIQINRPDYDPQNQLSQDPTQPEAPQLAQGCQNGSIAAGRFVITGRGGLASNPTEPLSNTNIWEDIHPPQSVEQTQSTTEVIEAQGWMSDEQGKIVLVSQDPKTLTKFRCEIDQSEGEIKVKSAKGSSTNQS